ALEVLRLLGQACTSLRAALTALTTLSGCTCRILDGILRLVQCRLLLLLRTAIASILHILECLLQLVCSLCKLRILSVARQFLKLPQQILSLTFDILLGRTIGSASPTVTGLSALACSSFLTLGKVREFLGKFIDFLLFLLILLTLRLTAFDRFILV